VAGPSKGRRPLPPSPPPVHCKSEGVSDPTRRLQSRPRGHPRGRSRPQCHRFLMRWVQACCVASCRFNSCSDRRRSGGRVVPSRENPIASGSCGTLQSPLVPLIRQLACGVRVRSFWPATTSFNSGATRARVKPRRSAPTRSGCGLDPRACRSVGHLRGGRPLCAVERSVRQGCLRPSDVPLELNQRSERLARNAEPKGFNHA
jgi:hypothetical protein